MTSVRCRGNCGTFFDKKLAACPACGTAKVPLNRALVNARWSSNLNAQAEHAVKYG